MIETDSAVTPRESPGASAVCAHCGEPCHGVTPLHGDRVFCCLGCRTVFELLEEHGLGRYYRLEATPGTSMTGRPSSRFDHLDSPDLADRLLDFASATTCRITLEVPAIHCIACVWLLENLFRLDPGIGESRVDFPRRRLSVSFDRSVLPLARLVELLASLGYEPTLTLDRLEPSKRPEGDRRLALQLGITGFCLGNVMLLAFPSYLGLEIARGEELGRLFAWLGLALVLPVVTFGAADFWHAAAVAIRRRIVTIDVPIALGLAGLFGRSVWEVASGTGSGYADSLAALVFLLLCGRWLTRRTYDRLAFDRDYTAYFPLAVARRTPQGEETVPLTSILPGDRIVVRNRELIPADGKLLSGLGQIDYSFVTGESLPLTRHPGEPVYAGGRQLGPTVEIAVEREVSAGYLASLWQDEAFRRTGSRGLDDLTNRVSRTFTLVVVGIAAAAAAAWVPTSAATALEVFVSVLIVACPCAFALAAPFALGTARTVLGRAGLFLRSASVVERLAGVRTLVFDKTGTLTRADGGHATWLPVDGPSAAPPPLRGRTRSALAAVLDASGHPHARLVRGHLGPASPGAVTAFVEEPGQGLRGTCLGVEIACGSTDWLERQGVEGPFRATGGSAVHVAADGLYAGSFEIRAAYRNDLAPMFDRLKPRFRLALTSGDNDREREHLAEVLGPSARLAFGQNPHDKLALVRQLRREGPVLMVGDGLNDAGALGASDVGIAVTEEPNGFAPACDAILEADRLVDLPQHLHYARRVLGVVALCFGVSFLYNVVGVSFAATGQLSPLVSAVLMPLSSATVVGLAVGLTRYATRGVLRS